MEFLHYKHLVNKLSYLQNTAAVYEIQDGWPNMIIPVFKQKLWL